MSGPSGIGKEPNATPIHNQNQPTPSKSFQEVSRGGGEPPPSFAQQAWGFNAEEAKKFISTLANTIISQIKHEDERAKETADKLKQAEQGQDE